MMFTCPVCKKPLSAEGSSLVCPARHTFDLARQGYVNLLLKKPDHLYESKALFTARRAVYAAGFWTPVTDAVDAALPGGVVLDAGCGEGSLLAALAHPGRQTLGLDISKTAIQMAAARDKQSAFCVGDLCRIPLANQSVDGIANLLTPANYDEFARVLRPGSVLVKGVPGPAHLREIREMTGKAPYAHALSEALAVLEKRFVCTAQQTIRYAVPCGEALAAQVFAMTPLTAHETAQGPLPASITVEVTLLTAIPRQA